MYDYIAESNQIENVAKSISQITARTLTNQYAIHSAVVDVLGPRSAWLLEFLRHECRLAGSTTLHLTIKYVERLTGFTRKEQDRILKGLSSLDFLTFTPGNRKKRREITYDPVKFMAFFAPRLREITEGKK